MTAKTILIADDDYELVEVLAMRCRQLGLNVLPAYDGISALRIIDEQVPDLICLDVNMPLGNGLGVCEMMAPDQQLASIPVIVLTGRSDDQTLRKCQALGAHYLHKSHDVWGLLRSMLYELLDLGNPEPENPKPEDPAPESAAPGDAEPCGPGKRDAADWDDLAPAASPRCLTHLIEVVTHGDSHR